MKHRLFYVFGLVVLGSLWLAAGPAAADAVGPYYAAPSWDQTLPAATRFIVLSNFNSEAVLDRETGLVWEKSPVASAISWPLARVVCTTRTVGGRKAWRLPSFSELASLIDPAVANPGPMLPPGHPFTNIQTNGSYWSATTSADNPVGAWGVQFFDGNVLQFQKIGSAYVWCVRSAGALDNY
jgi:hypothetical protein